MHVSVSFCFFFFFQAEDGIRDVAVTGVQTCALPIWTSSGSPASCFAKACRWGAGALKASAINGESVASTRAGIRHLLKPVWLRRRDGQGCASHLLGLAEQSVAVFLFDTSGNLIGRLLFAAK